MLITHLGHSAVLYESDGTRILIDPGNFDPEWHDLTGLTAVLITHQHGDHLDPVELPGLLRANPDATVIVEPSILDLIGREPQGGADVVPELPGAVALTSGETVKVGSVAITGVGGQHAIIHSDLPRIANLGYLITADDQPTFFHPGDSYEYAPEGVEVLAFPAQAPWAALKEGIDFARAVAAPRGFPVHDGLLRDRGRDIVIGRISAMTPTQLVDLRGAGPYQF